MGAPQKTCKFRGFLAMSHAPCRMGLGYRLNRTSWPVHALGPGSRWVPKGPPEIATFFTCGEQIYRRAPQTKAARTALSLAVDRHRRRRFRLFGAFVHRRVSLFFPVADSDYPHKANGSVTFVFACTYQRTKKSLSYLGELPSLPAITTAIRLLPLPPSPPPTNLQLLLYPTNPTNPRRPPS